MKRDKVAEIVGVLAVMRLSDPSLPDPTPLLTAKPAHKRALAKALDVAESFDVGLAFESEAFGDLTRALDEALPGAWPANWGSFIRNFHEAVRGRAPTTKVMDMATGDVSLVPTTVPKLPGAKS